jgi:hypothetical protein
MKNHPTPADKKIQAFLGYCLLHYSTTRFEFEPKPKLKVGTMEYTGEALPNKLTIATGGNTNDWLQVFLHETCHLDQAKERPEYFDSIDTYIADLDNWLEGAETISEISWENVSRIVELEHDCELRAIHKIKKFDLPISIEEYSQKANAYLASYINTLKNRKWDSAPYINKDVWGKMPKELMPLDYFDKVAQEKLSKIVNKDKPLTGKLNTIPDMEM